MVSHDPIVITCFVASDCFFMSFGIVFMDTLQPLYVFL